MTPIVVFPYLPFFLLGGPFPLSWSSTDLFYISSRKTVNAPSCRAGAKAPRQSQEAGGCSGFDYLWIFEIWQGWKEEEIVWAIVCICVQSHRYPNEKKRLSPFDLFRHGSWNNCLVLHGRFLFYSVRCFSFQLIGLFRKI